MVRMPENPDDTLADADPVRLAPPRAPDGTESDGVGSLDADFAYSLKLGDATVAIVSGFARIDAPAQDPDHWTVGDIYLNEVAEAELADGELGTGTTGGSEKLDEQHFLYALVKLAFAEHENHFDERWAEHLNELQQDADTPAMVVRDPPAPEPAAS